MSYKEIRIDTRDWFPRFQDFLIIFLFFIGFTVLGMALLLVVFFLFKNYFLSGSSGPVMFSPDLLQLPPDLLQNTAFLILVVFFTYVFPMGLTIWATLKKYRLKPVWKWKPTGIHALPFLLLTWFFMLIFLEGIMKLLPNPQGEFEIIKLMIKSQPFVAFLLLAVAAPLLEEILFRGIILHFLLKKTSPRTAIVLSALMFGLFHLNIWQFTGAFIMGIYFGFLYWKTRSLFYPVLFHFINNALAFWVTLQFGDMEKGITDITGWENITIYLIAGLLFGLSLYGLNKNWNPGNPELILASGNPHKLNEIMQVLPSKFRLYSYKKFLPGHTLKETGNTLEANALEKAMQIARTTGANVLSDDTGLEVEVLNGKPGVLSARYAGEKATSEDNRKKLLEEMQNQNNRKALFKTVMALNLGNRWYLFEGIARGNILREEKGEGGFGYDPIFQPEDLDKSFAQLTTEEKNQISHRGKALHKLIAFLTEWTS